MTSKTTNKFSPEVRARAVRMVLDPASEHPSRWAAVTSIAAKIGCTPQTLHDWVKKAEVDRGQRAGVPTDMADKLKALERENRELPSPPLNGSIGSTTEGSWSPLATYRRQRPSNATTHAGTSGHGGIT
jgi:transposase